MTAILYMAGLAVLVASAIYFGICYGHIIEDKFNNYGQVALIAANTAAMCWIVVVAALNDDAAALYLIYAPLTAWCYGVVVFSARCAGMAPRGRLSGRIFKPFDNYWWRVCGRMAIGSLFSIGLSSIAGNVASGIANTLTLTFIVAFFSLTVEKHFTGKMIKP